MCISRRLNLPVSSVVEDVAIGAEGLGFDSRACQIGHSVVNGSSLQRSFFGAASVAAQALSSGGEVHHSLPLRRNTASIMMKILFF